MQASARRECREGGSAAKHRRSAGSELAQNLAGGAVRRGRVVTMEGRRDVSAAYACEVSAARGYGEALPRPQTAVVEVVQLDDAVNDRSRVPARGDVRG